MTIRRPPAFRLIAAVAIPIVLFGWGCWAALGPLGGSGVATGQVELELCDAEKNLSSDRIGAATDASCAGTAMRLVSLARQSGIDPREALYRALPDAHRVIAMLSRDRDVEEFEEYATRGGLIGGYYAAEASFARRMRPLRSRFEAVYASAFAALVGRDASSLRSGVLAGDPSADYLGGEGRRKPYVAAPGDVWFPARSELRKAHQYALDIFFFRVERSGGAERGPSIHALYPGIVVCSASDWNGGQGEAAWRSGGLSPAAGNGVVVYDPATRRYVSYFHLSSTSCRAGDIVKAGEILGRGGNTGVHARTTGHGEHVHVEIFDCARDANLSIYEVYDLMRR